MSGNHDIQDADPKDLPDTIAMQDDFTREFMASAEEIEEGYYLFESKTAGYTMLYPVNSKQSKMSYEKKKTPLKRCILANAKKVLMCLFMFSQLTTKVKTQTILNYT